jgi:acyl-homoserine-lactone acylase
VVRVRVVLAAVAALLVALPAAAHAQQYKVSVKRTAHGIPHIQAKDWASLGYGYGYAIAQDNICVLADTYTTVRAERSRFFGPGGSYSFRGNGTQPNNLNSDFFYKRIIDEGTVERLLAQAPPHGPLPEIRQAVTGYVAGYNAYLRETGVANIGDPACRGKEWVRPIEEIDAYRRFYQLALLASGGVAIDGIGAAAPLTGGSGSFAGLPELGRRLDEVLGGIGSNAYGMGTDKAEGGGGLLLGNPHFPWDGSERFWQSHLTIPGKVDVQGGSLFGVPLILIGNTRGMAWSHTVSTARRFTPFELKLVPGDPTSYIYDGAPRKMAAREVTVKALKEDGTLEDRRRTLYASHHGPILTSILGLPVFPWSSATAYAMGDVNAGNFRYLNHFFETNQAQTVDQLHAVETKYLAIPWVNTIAADSTGKAYYADIGAIPNVSNAKLQQCQVPLGTAIDQAARLQVLDGASSQCEWDTDPQAVAPGIFGPKSLPFMFRSDYVMNANDSYWLSNPRQRLEGYARIIGDERTARSPRTRLGFHIAEDGGTFSRQELQDAVFNNRQYLGELWRGELVTMCEQMGSGVADACPVLKTWNLRDDVDSRGAVLFRRFATRALAASGGPWREAFDAGDPLNTPRGLNTSHPQVRQALTDAVADLRNAKIPLDAPLGDWQYEKRGDERIPIHGGPGTVGVFNAINVVWNPQEGYANVPHGSSYVQVVRLAGKCPEVRTILTYSQSADPSSPWFADQTRMFSGKRWVEMPFCGSSKKPRVVDETHVGGKRLIASARVRRVGRKLVIHVTTRRSLSISVAAQRARKVRRARSPAGRVHRVVLRRVPRGRTRVTITARAGKLRHTVTRTTRR